ncbi:MAG: trans-aconitate 2-methyltransferase [Gammaproteobacteria bacterium]
MNRQTWDPATYQRDAGFVAALGTPLLDLLELQPGQRVLDIGCGDGALTAKIGAAGATVVAVDSSPDQVQAARARGLDAHVMDAHDLPYAEEFDAVFSNAALHWMLEPARVLAGIARALKRGGRFVGEMGGAGNVQSVVRAYAAEFASRGLDLAHANPWFFPTAAEYRTLLENAGFAVQDIALFERPTVLPGDVTDWLKLMTQSFFGGVPTAAQPALINAVRSRLQHVVRRDNGTWELDYVRLRFVAVKR